MIPLILAQGGRAKKNVKLTVNRNPLKTLGISWFTATGPSRGERRPERTFFGHREDHATDLWDPFGFLTFLRSSDSANMAEPKTSLAPNEGTYGLP